MPTLVVCLVAGVVLIVKWKQAPIASLWALFGFGLLLFLCFAGPAGQARLQKWVMQDANQFSRMWAFTAFGIANSVLHAASYVLLLVAIFAGRSTPDAAIPPSLNRQ